MRNDAGARGIFGSRIIGSRIIRFLSVGVLNTIFGYAVYALLIFINLPYLMALLLATVAGIIFNYFSFGRLVFSSHSNRTVFAKFVMAYGLIYSANAALLSFLTIEFFLNAYAAQAICVPPSVLLSWLLMNHWVYKKA